MDTAATFPIEKVRQQFPALARTHNGQPVAYFDGPGGSQFFGKRHCEDQ